jgi:hypothetical protein
MSAFVEATIRFQMDCDSAATDLLQSFPSCACVRSVDRLKQADGFKPTTRGAWAANTGENFDFGLLTADSWPLNPAA